MLSWFTYSVEVFRIYDHTSKLTFFHQSYVEVEGKFDLVISSNAGSVSMDCKQFMKNGTLLLVNNGHSDADNAFEDDTYIYLGYYKFSGNKEKVSFVMDGESKKSNTYYLFRYKGEWNED